MSEIKPLAGASVPTKAPVRAISLYDRTHWVYRLRDAAGEVIYVGRTSDPDSRMQAHAARAEFWAEVASTEMSNPMSQNDAVAYERQAIYFERPRHNVDGNPDRDPRILRAIDEGRHQADREFAPAEHARTTAYAARAVELLTPRSARQRRRIA